MPDPKRHRRGPFDRADMEAKLRDRIAMEKQSKEEAETALFVKTGECASEYAALEVKVADLNTALSALQALYDECELRCPPVRP